MLTGPFGRGRRDCGGVAAPGRGFSVLSVVTGVLLVGGASRRFGRPKAMAVYRGETLAERAWRLLGESCDEAIAVGKSADELELPFGVLDDGSPVRAPLAGLVAGLRAATHEICVAVPVDMPLLTSGALRQLASSCVDAAVPQTGPLPGAYHRRALPVLERRLRSGELALAASSRRTRHRDDRARRGPTGEREQSGGARWAHLSQGARNSSISRQLRGSSSFRQTALSSITTSVGTLSTPKRVNSSGCFS